MVFSISDQWEVGLLKDAACLCKLFLMYQPPIYGSSLCVCVRARVKAPLQLHSYASLRWFH